MDLYVVPFVCVFTNIVTLKSSFQEIAVVGYEQVNEKLEKTGGLYMKMETYCGISNIDMNGVSKNTMDRICAIAGRNI